ncbi:hypothetical protein chiPu_0029487, partial [Chiloscyllium punctatum]|nr:hypothetical protein [Chiloscyllium punctatum]
EASCIVDSWSTLFGNTATQQRSGMNQRVDVHDSDGRLSNEDTSQAIM